MCGVFPPVYLARGSSSSHPLPRLALCLAGKTMTCAFLGVLAGLAGEVMVERRLAGTSSRLLAYVIAALSRHPGGRARRSALTV